MEPEWERQLLEAVASVYSLFQWPGVVLLMAVESIFVPLPSELVMPLSGWMLIQKQGLGPVYTLLAGFYGALGNLLGSLLLYWVGLKGGRPLLQRYGKYFLIRHGDLERTERWFSRYGEVTVFFSRLVPGVRSLISLPAGIARMNLPRFCLYTFLGSYSWALGLAYGGYLLGENWWLLRSWTRPLDIPLLIGLALLVAFYAWHRIRQWVLRLQGCEEE